MVKIFKSLNDINYIKLKNKSTSQLGSGAFGEVHLVSYKNNLEKKFAMKTIKKIPEMIQKIYQEIKLHENLKHPNIIKFEDYIET